MRRRHSFATVLVGKDCLRREGIARILRAADFRILISVPNADDWVAGKAQADQALFIVVQPGDDFETAAEQIGTFRGSHPNSRIALIAERYRSNEMISAMRAGANGYFVDAMTSDVFIKSLELVMMGETVFPPAFLSSVLGLGGDHIVNDDGNAAPLKTDEIIAPQLSPREKMILDCLIRGDSNKSIARKIDIAEATVKVHVKAILRKIRVQNRTQAAIWGMNHRPQLRSEHEEAQQALETDRRVSVDSPSPSAPDRPREVIPVGMIKAEAHPSKRIPANNGHLRKDVDSRSSAAIRLHR